MCRRQRRIKDLAGRAVRPARTGPAEAGTGNAALAQLADRAESYTAPVGILAIAQFTAYRCTPASVAPSGTERKCSEVFGNCPGFAKIAAA